MLPLTSSVSVCIFPFCFFVRVGDGGGCCSWGGGGAAEPGRVGPRRVFTAAALWSRLRGVGRGRTAVGLRWRARGCERRRRVGVRRPTFGHLPGRRGRQRWPCWGEPDWPPAAVSKAIFPVTLLPLALGAVAAGVWLGGRGWGGGAAACCPVVAAPKATSPAVCLWGDSSGAASNHHRRVGVLQPAGDEDIIKSSDERV